MFLYRAVECATHNNTWRGGGGGGPLDVCVCDAARHGPLMLCRARDLILGGIFACSICVRGSQPHLTFGLLPPQKNN